MLLILDCSSVFNYSNGLNLLLRQQEAHESCAIEPDPDLQLASTKNRLACGWASSVCFNCSAAGRESPSHLKVGPTIQHQQPHDDLKLSPDSEKVIKTSTSDLDNLENTNVGSLKSSLKRPSKSMVASMAANGGDTDTERRKVQWTDVCGGELFEIREFEPSEHSDDECENWDEGKCSCSIM